MDFAQHTTFKIYNTHTKEGQQEGSAGFSDVVERDPKVLHTMKRKQGGRRAAACVQGERGPCGGAGRKPGVGGGGEDGGTWVVGWGVRVVGKGLRGEECSAARVGTEFSKWKTLTFVKIATAGLKIAAGEINVQ